jgi:deoxycytidine triphosphate deaminase
MTNPSQPQNYFAQTDEEAQERFERYQSQDPFPEIVPALLNSADIYDYVAVTAMVHPFNTKKLKSASYAVPILGKVVYWDENNQKKVENIELDQEFILRPNSIAFVTIEPRLRLPDYIALRFNLKITNVYRGILLGTGPLIDPGFNGKLSIPLHNLTTNDYKFIGGEDLIWMEFTKLSPNERWNSLNTISSNPIRRIGQYVEFPSDKSLPDVEGYLRKADQHRSIRSSISEALENARTSAQKAAESAEEIAAEVKQSAEELERKVEQKVQEFESNAEKLENTVEQKVKEFETIKNFVSVTALIGTIASAAALIALFLQMFSVVREKDELVNKANNQIEALQKEIKTLKNDLKNLQNR